MMKCDGGLLVLQVDGGGRVMLTHDGGLYSRACLRIASLVERDATYIIVVLPSPGGRENGIWIWIWDLSLSLLSGVERG